MTRRLLTLMLLAFALQVKPAASDSGPLREMLEAAISNAGLIGAPAISQHRPVPDCDHPPGITVDREVSSLTLSCDAPRWRRIIRITQQNQSRPQAPVAQTVLTLAESLPAGTILQPAHIVETKAPQAAAGTALVLRDQAIGRRLKTALGAGRVLQARHLEMSYTLHKGDVVTVTLNAQGIQIAAEATALSNAQLGERVDLQSLSSDRILTGIVTGKGKVSVTAKTF